MKYCFSFLYIKYLLFIYVALFCFNLLAENGVIKSSKSIDIFGSEAAGESVCTPRYTQDITINRRMNDPYIKKNGIKKNGKKKLKKLGHKEKVQKDLEKKDSEKCVEKKDIEKIGETKDVEKKDSEKIGEKKDLEKKELKVDISSANIMQNYLTRKFDFSLQGAITLEGMYDTRQVVGYKYNQYTFFPAPQKLDATGLDINDKSQFNMMGIRAFCAAILKGPDVWDAKTLALIEGDFSGINDETVSLFRLKKAFATLSWENTSVLLGQYYHPLNLDELYPEVVSAGRGVIYDPYRFAPQFRIRHKIDQFEFVLAIAKRFDSKASRTAAMPDLFGQLNVRLNDQVIGAGINYHSEVPRLYSQVTNNSTELNSAGSNSPIKLFKTTESVNSIYPFVFAALKFEPFDIRTKLTYAENGNVYALIGGYAVESRNERTDERIYINLRTIACWTDIIYKRLSHLEPGLFVGVSKNIGASRNIIKGFEEGLDENVIDPDFSTLLQVENITTGIDYTFILSPRLRVRFGELSFGAELEYTRASFARPISDPDWANDFNCKGVVVCGKPVNNFRMLLATFYNFDYCPFGVS